MCIGVRAMPRAIKFQTFRLKNVHPSLFFIAVEKDNEINHSHPISGKGGIVGRQCIAPALPYGFHVVSKYEYVSPYRLMARTSTPPATIAIPTHSRRTGRSPRNAHAKIATNTRLSLSTGATFDASPTWSARK